MPKQFFCEGREPNFKFGSAISSLWLRHKLAVEKSAHQCDFSTFSHGMMLWLFLMVGIRRDSYGIYGNRKTDAAPDRRDWAVCRPAGTVYGLTVWQAPYHQERGTGGFGSTRAGRDKGKPKKVQKMDAKNRHAVFVTCRFRNQNCFKMSWWPTSTRIIILSPS